MPAKPRRKSGAKRRKAAPRRAAMARAPLDLLLKGGRVVDPANAVDGLRDVGIRDGKIAAVEVGIPREAAAHTHDVAGLLVLPGLIDTHAHVFEHVAGDFGLNADDVGVRSGVTTIVDQGGPSALTINGFRKFIVEASNTRVLCFISAYLVGGLHGHRYVDLYGPDGINVEALVAAARSNRDIVRGIKVHAEPGGYSRWGVAALKLAKQASRRLGIPIYIHLGTLWPEADGARIDPQRVIDEIEPLLDAGDVLAHPFTRHPSGFVSPKGEVHPLVFKAIERGVRIDVGRGGHFSFASARAVVKAGVVPFTLGADLHGYNVGKSFDNRGTWSADATTYRDRRPAATYDPSFSIYTAMSELLAIGVSELDAIKTVTANAADMLGMSGEIGTLGVGRRAELSVLALKEGDFTLKDSVGASLKTRRQFLPAFAVRNGVTVELDSPLLPGTRAPARRKHAAANAGTWVEMRHA